MTLPSMAQPHPTFPAGVVEPAADLATPSAPAHRRLRVAFRLLVILGLVVGLASACIPLESDEQYLYDRTNELRAQNGLPPVLIYDELTTRARELAQQLASRKVLEHSDLHQIPFKWAIAGENIGRGTDIKTITDLFMASPSHRANILNPRFQSQSVGIARASDGTIYVVALFTG
jgi:uncharacterized protein YkwD